MSEFCNKVNASFIGESAFVKILGCYKHEVNLKVSCKCYMGILEEEI